MIQLNGPQSLFLYRYNARGMECGMTRVELPLASSLLAGSVILKGNLQMTACFFVDEKVSANPLKK
jgi:hypothetical protein